MNIRLCDGNCALQRCYFSLLVPDLPFQSALLRNRVFKGIFIGTVIDFVQQFAFFHELVVFHVQPDERTVDLGRYADEISKYFGIFGPRIIVLAVKYGESQDHRGRYDCDADCTAQRLAPPPLRGHAINLAPMIPACFRDHFFIQRNSSHKIHRNRTIHNANVNTAVRLG